MLNVIMRVLVDIALLHVDHVVAMILQYINLDFSGGVHGYGEIANGQPMKEMVMNDVKLMA